ncbi:MAG TPA: azurin [Aequorivita sp.]|nr:azurin [Aequorivita sp.]
MKKILLVLVVAVAMGCGDTKKEENPQIQIGTQEDGQTSSTETADEAVATVTIDGNDQMKYNKNEIRVKTGQKVKLTLNHVGKMEKTVMGHNWVLLTQDADVAAVGLAAATASETDYIPASMKDKIIVHTKMLGGGETDIIEFDAPAPGTYTFMCTFPGHYALMQGKFIVE